MAEQEILRLAQQNVEAFISSDWQKMKDMMGSNPVYQEFATQRRIEGVEPILEANRGWKNAFPDTNASIEKSMVDDNSVILEVTWRGTQTGTLDGPTGSLPPSGRTVVVPAVLSYRFEGGKIKELRHYFDLMTILQQVGALPQGAYASGR